MPQETPATFEDLMLQVNQFVTRHNATEDLVLEVLFRHMYDGLAHSEDHSFLFQPIKHRPINLGLTKSDKLGYFKIAFLDDSVSGQDIFGFAPPERADDTIKTMLTKFVLDQEQPDFKYNFIAGNSFGENDDDEDDEPASSDKEQDAEQAEIDRFVSAKENFDKFKQKRQELFPSDKQVEQIYPKEELTELLAKHDWTITESIEFTKTDIPTIAKIILDDFKEKQLEQEEQVEHKIFTIEFIIEAINEEFKAEIMSLDELIVSINATYFKKRVYDLATSDSLEDKRQLFENYGDSCEISCETLCNFLCSEAADRAAESIMADEMSFNAYSNKFATLSPEANSLSDYGLHARYQFKEIMSDLEVILAPYKLDCGLSDIFEYSLAKIYSDQTPTAPCQFGTDIIKSYGIIKRYLLVRTGLETKETRLLVDNINKIQPDAASYVRLDFPAMNLSYDFIRTHFLPNLPVFLEANPEFVAQMQLLYKNAITDKPDAKFFADYHLALRDLPSVTISSAGKKLRISEDIFEEEIIGEYIFEESTDEEQTIEIADEQELDLELNADNAKKPMLSAFYNYLPSVSTVLALGALGLAAATFAIPKSKM